MMARIDSALIPAVVCPQENCAWCWYVKHPTEAFPEQESSSICPEHGDWQLARVAAARRLRQEADPGQGVKS